MKNKILALVLALAFVLAMAIPAAAADTEITQASENKTGNTTLTYTVASRYTVTIPEAITIGAGTGTGTADVSVAAGALIAHGTSITVALTTCDFKLTNGDDNIAYTINADVVQGDIVLTHAAGTTTATTEDLAVMVTGTPKYSGAYSDTVTFTVAVA